MEIVPQDRALVIDGKASPTDADDLAPGMETQIRFTALQERNLPILVGQISKISADSFEDERSGIRYFKIELVMPPSELAKLRRIRSEEHTSELQSLMRISYDGICLKKQHTYMKH